MQSEKNITYGLSCKHLHYLISKKVKVCCSLSSTRSLIKVYLHVRSLVICNTINLKHVKDKLPEVKTAGTTTKLSTDFKTVDVF